MKVTKNGNPWYVGKECKCNGCGCEVTLELYDNPKFKIPYDGDCYHYVECPQCGIHVQVNRELSKENAA